jgi:hypothetical protein
MRASDNSDAHAAVHRRRIEVGLARCLSAGRGQAVGAVPALDHLVSEMIEVMAADATQRSLSMIDLLVRVDIARRDWRSLTDHVAWADAAARLPDAPANLVQRINRRLRAVADRTRLERYALPIPVDPFRDRRLIPPSPSQR